MIRRNVALSAFLFVSCLLLASAWNTAEAKTAHLTVKDGNVLHITYHYNDAHSKDVYIAPPPMENVLPYRDSRLERLHGPYNRYWNSPFDRYWVEWQYRRYLHRVVPYYGWCPELQR